PVVSSLRRAAYDYREARFAIDRFEHAIETLRQDVWQATTLRRTEDGSSIVLELDGGRKVVTWHSPEPGVLIREATSPPRDENDAPRPEPVRRWWGLGAEPRFEPGLGNNAGTLTLHLESPRKPGVADTSSHRTDRIVMISAA